MPRIKRGSNVSFFAAFYFALLEFNALSVYYLLALLRYEGGNKGIKREERQPERESIQSTITFTFKIPFNFPVKLYFLNF